MSFELKQLKLEPRMAMSGWVINKDLGGQTDASDWDITNVNGHLVFVTGNPETDNDDLLVSPIPSMAVNGIIMPSRVSRNQVLIHFMLMALSTLVRRKILDSMFPIRHKWPEVNPKRSRLRLC